MLVKKIHSIKTIVVNTEYDALLLENNLIKEYQPRYNVSLKDDKTYPWVCIKNERFPRVFYTRKKINDGSEYFAPYASVNSIKTLMAFIKENFKLRTCSLDLSEKNINAKKFRACLDYHIGTCKAPCVNLQTEEEYDQTIKQIKNILKDFEGAILDYTKAIQLDSSIAAAYYNRGYTQINKSDYTAGIKDMDTTLHWDSTYLKAYNVRGDAKAQTKDYSGAIKDYNKIVEMNPSDAVTYFNRAFCEIQIGQAEKACLDLTKAKKLGMTKATEVIQKYCNQKKTVKSNVRLHTTGTT